MAHPHLHEFAHVALEVARRVAVLEVRRAVEVEPVCAAYARGEMHVFQEAVALELRELLPLEKLGAVKHAGGVQPVRGDEVALRLGVARQAVDRGAEELAAIRRMRVAGLHAVVEPEQAARHGMLHAGDARGDAADGAVLIAVEGLAERREARRRHEDIVIDESHERRGDAARALIALHRGARALGSLVAHRQPRGE